MTRETSPAGEWLSHYRSEAFLEDIEEQCCASTAVPGRTRRNVQTTLLIGLPVVLVLVVSVSARPGPDRPARVSSLKPMQHIPSCMHTVLKPAPVKVQSSQR